MKFKIGDNVRWSTDKCNILLKKKGKIVFIIDPFITLIEVINSKEFKNNIGKNINLICNKLNDYKCCESYLIMVGKRDGQIPVLHWVEVINLNKIRKRKVKIKIKEKYDEER